MNTKNLSFKMLAVSLFIVFMQTTNSATPSELNQFARGRHILENTAINIQSPEQTTDKQKKAIAQLDQSIKNVFAARESRKNAFKVWQTCINDEGESDESCDDHFTQYKDADKFVDGSVKIALSLAQKTCKKLGHGSSYTYKFYKKMTDELDPVFSLSFDEREHCIADQ